MTNIMWRQGEIIELEITDLNDTGDGVGRFEQRVVFVPDTVPGDRLLVKLLNVKPKYAYGQVQELLQASPQRVRPSCIVADKCGGCQWQHIKYDYQLIAKQNQVIQALERIGGFVNIPVNPVLVAATSLGYRNKVTYPLGIAATGHVQAGYYHKGTHKLINLNQCPVQDPRLNPLLAEVKLDIEKQGWSIYDETRHKGLIRHLGLRIGRRTGEMLLTLVVKDRNLPGIENQAQQWLQRYPQLVGVSLNRNSDRTNAIFGLETRCLAGVPYLREKFAGLDFQIRPDTFFQVYTETAEALLEVIQSELNLQGHEVLVDAYCGIGTLTLPLAKQAKHIIGLELQSTAVKQAIVNAQENRINNVTFQVGAVEKILQNLEIIPDVVLLDPPRKGCEDNVIKTLRNLKPSRIVYVSCKVSTLARDLKLLCENGLYRLTRVQPADFFPQTAHVEAAAFLALSDNDQSS
ncbi:23S rRNA (uracil(1939)-C(5))-methyltransferase RlmD [Anabaena sp. FACHB-1250]|uniref:TrmA family RNA methyltransferase n=1 Tax=Dolichospermum planctonicum TaxID=136072 RepID=A0A480AIN7_9CYAN|nr:MULTISPECIES: 23S rRNA (uracil(1939)-C(5))-methyltransferase RlmD [Nostocales]MBD2143418.1 23S rRNA (uracil(1939)-C(5))-methyltransferase RlmD [Anabaena sp. FACHB-1250]MBD2270528.1 23S rRNA (uracil(1939)-C(5))-methyltransferase RlmD [Anabaena sp. FACHB-1391]GCL43643.1 TrmA family RNA methyltransferase [Dolichospermum planctonicum]